jgi:hypothetical protein
MDLRMRQLTEDGVPRSAIIDCGAAYVVNLGEMERVRVADSDWAARLPTCRNHKPAHGCVSKASMAPD